jgi:uncharacterized iron-regulated membrane protein
MRIARRSFLKGLIGIVSVLFGGSQLSGCLGQSDAQQPATPNPATQPSSPAPTAPTTGPTPAAPTHAALNSAPVWQSSPRIEFVEGVPAVISVRQFVRDADLDPVVITLRSGKLLPGIIWDPNKFTIAYDGRPLGAKPNAPVVVTGITFSADDRKQ